MPASRSGFEKVSRSSEIRAVRRKGRKAAGKFTTAWVADRAAGDDGISLGIVTSKGFRSAHSRNRAKRRTRGCIMDARGLLKPGHAYLIECRPGADGVNYQLLAEDIESILTRAGA